MARPNNRNELATEIAQSWNKLDNTLSSLTPSQAQRTCVDDFTVTDLLAVRLWWTRRVNRWISQGKRGHTPKLPAPNYSWRQTPQLNQQIAATNPHDAHTIHRHLKRAANKTLDTIDSLNDRELMEVGIFAWTGKWPVSRWISINTARQYTTAATYIRRTLR